MTALILSPAIRRLGVVDPTKTRRVLSEVKSRATESGVSLAGRRLGFGVCGGEGEICWESGGSAGDCRVVPNRRGVIFSTWGHVTVR